MRSPAEYDLAWNHEGQLRRGAMMTGTSQKTIEIRLHPISAVFVTRGFPREAGSQSGAAYDDQPSTRVTLFLAPHRRKLGSRLVKP